MMVIASSEQAITQLLPLSRDNNGLVLLITNHTAVCIFCNSKQVWLQLAAPPARIGLDDIRAVEVDPSKGVGGD
jgi:hypothetical protein